MWLEGKIQSCGVNCTRASSWEKNKRNKPHWCIKTRQRNRRLQSFLKDSFVRSFFNGLEAEVKRKDRLYGLWLCHITFPPPAFICSFFARTDVIALGVSVLTEGAAAASSWWLGGLSEQSEGTQSFSSGVLCWVCCYLHIFLQLPKK